MFFSIYVSPAGLQPVRLFRRRAAPTPKTVIKFLTKRLLNPILEQKETSLKEL